MVLVIGIFLITRPQPARQLSRAQLSQPKSMPQVLSVAAYACQKGKTPFDILADMAKVETQDSSLGQTVASINGSSQSGDKHWVYTVDNKEATISASLYICSGEEVIRWELK